MQIRDFHGWRLQDWPSHARAIALGCWLAAVIMTGVLGWSAWSAFDSAADGVDRVVARHEAGVISKARYLITAGR